MAGLRAETSLVFNQQEPGLSNGRIVTESKDEHLEFGTSDSALVAMNEKILW
jgi:hypothetical protein